MTAQTDISTLALHNKVAIVTGASRGIGAGLALDLARKGAKVP
jgi:3-oxoacyl-[acyl-carrier protein] reductase